MNVLIGDSDASSRFVWTYVVGLGATVIALLAAGAIRD